MRRKAYGARGQRGTLETMPDGRTKARYREGGRDGKRPSQIFDTRREAASWLGERLEEVEAIQSGDLQTVTARREAGRTGAQAADDYLAAHEADPVTIRKLRRQLDQFKREFGPRLLREIDAYELQAWRKSLTPGARHDVFRATKQMLAQARRWHWLPLDPAAEIKNPRPHRREVTPPPWESVAAVAGEIDDRYGALPVFAAGTGLRVEEWAALHRSHLDLDARVVRVRQAFSQGRLIELGADGSKTRRQRREVPLRAAVVEALKAAPVRIDTPILFPSPRGDYLDTERFRERYWRPAVLAAGVDYFPPKDMRHAFASESLAAGLDLFSLSRRMGTSLAEIDATYGHLVADANERELALLDSWDARREATN